MTDFLYAKPNWLSGAMTVLDLFGLSQEFNSSQSAEFADRRAFNADIESLKKDFSAAWSFVRSSYAL